MHKRLFLLSCIDHEAVDEITGDVTNKNTLSIENTTVKDTKKDIGDMEKDSNSKSELNRVE